VEILYFAWVRERIGTNCERIDPPADVQDVSGLIDWLATRSPAHAVAFADKSRLRAAIDQRFVGLEDSIAGAREVAIFPPVTGG
jgi:molybdopterin synthase sulfur carrier subunit